MSDLPDLLRKLWKTKAAVKGAAASVPLAGSLFNHAIATGTVGVLVPSAPIVAVGVVVVGAWLGWHLGSAAVGEIDDWLDGKQ